jgi:HEAT repeat protein
VAIAPTAQAGAATESDAAREKKRKLMMAGGLAVFAAAVLWWQYRPVDELDSEAAGNDGVRQVVELERKKDASGLTQLARSDDSATARRAVLALADVGGLDAVRGALADKRPEVRYAAVYGLGKAADPSTLPLLSKYAQDPASEVRVGAIRSISNIRDFSIFEHLMPSLNDPDTSVRRAAIGAIEERVGLKFPDYKAEDPPEARARALGRIRASVSKMKGVFDRATAFEDARQQQQRP